MVSVSLCSSIVLARPGQLCVDSAPSPQPCHWNVVCKCLCVCVCPVDQCVGQVVDPVLSQWKCQVIAPVSAAPCQMEPTCSALLTLLMKTISIGKGSCTRVCACVWLHGNPSTKTDLNFNIEYTTVTYSIWDLCRGEDQWLRCLNWSFTFLLLRTLVSKVTYNWAPWEPVL